MVKPVTINTRALSDEELLVEWQGPTTSVLDKYEAAVDSPPTPLRVELSPPEPPPTEYTRFNSVHLEADLEPQSTERFEFLKSCLGAEGLTNYVKVHFNCDSSFWPWLSQIDPAVIESAYTQAAFLTGKHVSAAVDRVSLFDEAHCNQMSAQVREEEKAFYKRACLLLSQFHKVQSKKLIKLGVPWASALEYARFTAGSSLKSDYEIYLKAVAFREKLLSVANQDSVAETKTQVLNWVAKEKGEKTELVCALKRLHRIFVGP